MAWLESVRVIRGRFETMLRDWGCTPVAVAVGQDEFDPEIHEAVAAEPGTHQKGVPEHVIIQVRRRGWMLHGQVLTLPLVVEN